jgi:hypothetical protein
MAEIDGDDSLTGHSYSTEMMNFKMSYSYTNYLEPIVMEASDMAARNARDVAMKTLILAAAILVISLAFSWLDFHIFFQLQPS